MPTERAFRPMVLDVLFGIVCDEGAVAADRIAAAEALTRMGVWREPVVDRPKPALVVKGPWEDKPCG